MKHLPLQIEYLRSAEVCMGVKGVMGIYYSDLRPLLQLNTPFVRAGHLFFFLHLVVATVVKLTPPPPPTPHPASQPPPPRTQRDEREDTHSAPTEIKGHYFGSK